ncbi:MAG: hypothetical protein DRH97_00220 [Chloroflexi bacterium]|nr:MAG: hypothetical protein DRH97_00220 [Chloroflexota bacterium]
MIVCNSIKEVMTKHKMRPKEFSEATGMKYGTCQQIHKGQKSPQFDVFSVWLDLGLSHGKTIDELKKELKEVKSERNKSF